MTFIHSADPVSTRTHIPAAISLAISFLSAKVSVGGHLWSTAHNGCKMLSESFVSDHFTPSQPFPFFFFFNFDKGNIFEKNFIKIPEIPQDYKVSHQRAQILQTSEQSQNTKAHVLHCLLICNF